MSKKLKLSEIEKKILEVLIENPRISYRGIAKKLRVSPTTIVRRVRGLKSKGVIKGFAVIFTEEFLETLNCFILYVKPTHESEVSKLAVKISEINGICRVYITTGEYPVKAFGATSSREEFSNTISRILSLKGVRDVKSEWIIRHVREDYPKPKLETLKV